ncbi:MAG: L-rhamnose mutarotase [Planctomycetota bacterium]
MKRYGSVIGLYKHRIKEYVELHANVWPSVANMIHECNIRNYSIYLRKLPDGNVYLFSYFEYIGSDIEDDLEKMRCDPETQRWWSLCKPLQSKLPGVTDEAWWAGMEEVFHQD